MNPLSLRGDLAKERFVRKYKIRCVQHGVQLPGESDRCCCGKPVTQEFFRFAYGPDKAEEFFYAGANCGRKLLDLVGLPVPPLFDPFSLLVHTSGQGKAAANVVNAEESGIPVLNREMAQALPMLLFLWNNSAGYMKDTFEKLLNEPAMLVSDKLILTLNKAIRSTAERRNEQLGLREMFACKAKEKGLTSRIFHFPNLEKKLLNLGETSML